MLSVFQKVGEGVGLKRVFIGNFCTVTSEFIIIRHIFFRTGRRTGYILDMELRLLLRLA